MAGNATILSRGTYGNESAAAGTGNNNASLVFSNTGDLAFLTSTAKTLTLGGTSFGDNIFVPRITNNTVDSTVTSVTVSGGLWILNPAVANTYTGATSVTGGQLRAVDGVGIPTNSPISLWNGVLEVGGASFTRALAASVVGAGTVSLAGATGFAAGTTSRLVVSLAVGATPNAALTWATTAGFAPTSLVLGSSTALGETEITNNIALGTAARTITVNNNSNTGTMVTAGILSGIISGGAGGTLTKAGGGVLILGNANTYIANTIITGGNLVVTSIGNSTGTTSSSLGASGGALQYNVDGDLNGLIYVGAGEIASRPVTLSSPITANRTQRIDASGSGPLVLTALTNANTGAFTTTLELRGSNTDHNQITSVLANNGTGGTLAVGKTDGGVWVLNPAAANTFTGGITGSGGLLGLTTFGIGNASGLRFSNGGMFAYGTALTTAKPLTLGNNATSVFAGDKSITFTSAVIIEAGNNDITLANTLTDGATLNLNAGFSNLKAHARTLNFRGAGSTVVTGALANGTVAGQAVSIQIAPVASLTLAGAANTYTGKTTMAQGRLILSKTLGATGWLDFNGGTIEGTLDLTGVNALSHSVFFGGDPATFTGAFNVELRNAANALNWAASRTLVNDLGAGKTLTVSGGVTITTAATLTITGGGATVISGVIAAGTVATSLTFAGNSTLVITGAATATGTLTANRGTVTLSGANGAWSGTAAAVTINAGGTLTLDNATNNNNRLADAGAVNLMGGTLSLVGNATTEAAGALKACGSAAIAFSGTGSNTLTFASLDPTFYTDARSALNLVGVADLGVTNKVKVTGVADGLAPRVAVGADFATYVTADGFKAFSAYAAVTDINTSGADNVLKVTSAYSADDLTSSRYLRALAISDASSFPPAPS